jgi:ABC-2 type transport system permease protein
MWAIVKREWFVFFNTPLGYLCLGFFLTLSTILLWFLNTDFNLLNAGFADLNAFFVLAPWIFLLLVPALCMRSFTDEKRLGTLELLLTKPITLWQILLGKYIANLMLLLMALLPTVVYFFAIDALKIGDNPVDWGSTITAYWGLFCVGASFIALGILSAILTKSHASAFMLALLICFVQFYLWKGIADLIQDQRLFNFFNAVGIFDHYLNLRQGVITLKDVVYFLSVNYIILYISKYLLHNYKNHEL